MPEVIDLHTRTDPTAPVQSVIELLQFTLAEAAEGRVRSVVVVAKGHADTWFSQVTGEVAPLTLLGMLDVVMERLRSSINQGPLGQTPKPPSA